MTIWILLIVLTIVSLITIVPSGIQKGGDGVPVLLVDASKLASLKQKPVNELDKIKELLHSQQQMLKLAISKRSTSSKPKPICTKPKPICTKPGIRDTGVKSSSTSSTAQKLPSIHGQNVAPVTLSQLKKGATKQYRDWALAGKATQSSTYGSFQPSYAIDGNPLTFSHTNMEPNGKAWLKITLPIPIEISKIVIDNRADSPGSMVLRRRLPPFTVTIKNKSGYIVATQTFTDILSTYIWKDVYAVGSEIIIQQQKKNYLHVSEVKIFGVQADECVDYERYTSLNRDKVSNIYQRLKESACAAPKGATVDTYVPSQETVKVQAKKFEKVLAKQQRVQQARITAAKKQMVKIEAQQLKERQLALQAKKFGIRMPPPLYNEAQIASVRKAMNPPPVKLTDDDKSDCMEMYNRIQFLSAAASELAKEFGDDPSEEQINQVRALGSQIKKIQDAYNIKCGVPAKVEITVENMYTTPSVPEEDPELA